MMFFKRACAWMLTFVLSVSMFTVPAFAAETEDFASVSEAVQAGETEVPETEILFEDETAAPEAATETETEALSQGEDTVSEPEILFDDEAVSEEVSVSAEEEASSEDVITETEETDAAVFSDGIVPEEDEAEDAAASMTNTSSEKAVEIESGQTVTVSADNMSYYMSNEGYIFKDTTFYFTFTPSISGVYDLSCDVKDPFYRLSTEVSWSAKNLPDYLTAGTKYEIQLSMSLESGFGLSMSDAQVTKASISVQRIPDGCIRKAPISVESGKTYTITLFNEEGYNDRYFRIRPESPGFYRMELTQTKGPTGLSCQLSIGSTDEEKYSVYYAVPSGGLVHTNLLDQYMGSGSEISGSDDQYCWIIGGNPEENDPVTYQIKITRLADKLSGQCGTNLSWSMDTSGLLKITGTGAMYNYSSTNPAPWGGQYSTCPRSLQIASGVTSVGNYAFYGNASLYGRLELPSTLTSIGSNAFVNCFQTSNIGIPKSVRTIGDHALGYFQYGNGTYERNTYFKIYGYSGTAAETYAKANNITFVDVTPKPTAPAQLAAPKLGSASNTTSGVNITWGKVSGAAKYRVFRKVSGGAWNAIANTTAVSYVDKTAQSGTKYTYTVRCISSDGKTYTSSYDTKGITVLRLANPSVKLANQSNGIKVSWGRVKGATSYAVYRKTSSAKKWTYLKTVKTTSYVDKAVRNRNNTAYQYAVRAKNGNQISAYTAQRIVRITTPVITSVRNNAKRAVTVKWRRNNRATGYQIRYVTGSRVKTVTIRKNTIISRKLSSLIKGRTYKIYVRSYKTVGGKNYYSSWSSVKSVKVRR